jgi:molybdate transport system substrate-binding protein
MLNARAVRSVSIVAIAGSLATVATGCGSSKSSGSAAGTTETAPTVLAAASLTKVFPEIEPAAKYSFGGSGALQTQIEAGAPADVFAAASPKQPEALFAKGLVEKPVEFATNRLVLVTPAANPAHITSVADITKPGVKLVICNVSVPCGDYARTAFSNLKITTAAMKNVVSETTDVSQVLADVALGQADAGFVYITDAQAAGGKVRTLQLPERAKPDTKDYIAIVAAAKHRGGAEAFVQRVLSAEGQAKLRADGFGKP